MNFTTVVNYPFFVVKFGECIFHMIKQKQSGRNKINVMTVWILYG